MGTIGCKRYWFAGKTIDLITTPEEEGFYRIAASSDGPVRLKVRLGNNEEIHELNGRIEFTMQG